ncbi:MAG: glycosyltransferase family 2 protein [Candidatus Omnitrophota bacterium]
MYSIVIPVYKTEACLNELFKRVESVMAADSPSFEIIFVEDCGGDRSWEIIEKLCHSDSRVKGIQLSSNYGQHNALLCGIRAARGNIIITMDDDLQHPPEEIPKLLQKLSQGFDVVYGAPEKERHGVLRNLASQITKIVLQGTMGIKTARNVSAFRVFRTYLRNAFQNYQGNFVSIDVLLTWGTKRFTSVLVAHDPRRSGQSNYAFGSLLTHAFNMITGFCILPLQFASLLGFIVTLLGVIVLVSVLVEYFRIGGRVPGFPFLASIITLFSGAQLLVLGVMGEYLARMHFDIMEKPPYVIRSLTKKNAVPTENMASERNKKRENAEK